MMAKHLVDAALKKIYRSAPKSLAATTPIFGGATVMTAGLVAAAVAGGVTEDIATGWIRRSGSNTSHGLRYWQAHPAAREVIGPRGLTLAEVRYCVTEEMALTLSDLLVRRTSLFFWDAAGSLQRSSTSLKR